MDDVLREALERRGRTWGEHNDAIREAVRASAEYGTKCRPLPPAQHGGPGRWRPSEYSIRVVLTNNWFTTEISGTVTRIRPAE